MVHEDAVKKEGPKRFEVSGETLSVDSLLRKVIVFGGLAVILSVLAIFIFLFVQVIPLFYAPRVQEEGDVRTSPVEVLDLAVSESGDRVVLGKADGILQVYDMGEPGFVRQVSLPVEDRGVEVLVFYEEGERWWAGLNGGVVMGGIFHSEEGTAEKTVTLELPLAEGRVEEIRSRGSEDGRVTSVLQDGGPGEPVLSVWRESLIPDLLKMRTAGPPVEESVKLPPGRFQTHELLMEGRLLVALREDGVLFGFRRKEGSWQVEFRRPALPEGENGEVEGLSAMRGGGTLCIWTGKGRLYRYTPYFDMEVERFDLALMGSGVFSGNGGGLLESEALARVFLFARGNRLQLYHSTTDQTRWQTRMEEAVVAVAMEETYRHLAVLDAGGTLRTYSIRDPYPGAGLKAFFLPVHYEGRPGPTYEWQSSGATDAFEQKLSLVPLISGSLKGTFFALFFSAPLAICAALYTSQFLSERWRRWIKPIIELMASVPSVILGFLAALWLGPLFFRHTVSILSMLVAIPVFGILGGLVWGLLPPRTRQFVKAGHELFLVLPLFGLVAWTGWQAGTLVEFLFFGVTDPGTGARVHDFQLWWTEQFGAGLEQRNSAVVGFVLGFAVIPLIYSIAEEAFSSVPRNLISASLALGASRWQTARRVVFPAASAGLLSALMIGVGRAFGETMIVLMAAGNTPLMDLNPMTGFRALSASLAVELPEAPFGGALFRTLFLGAALLFVFTFIINTIAELLRSRLRETYRHLE